MPRSVEAVNQCYVDHPPSRQVFDDAGMRDYITFDVTVKRLKNYLNLESSPTVIKPAQNQHNFNDKLISLNTHVPKFFNGKRIFSSCTLKFRTSSDSSFIFQASVVLVNLVHCDIFDCNDILLQSLYGYVSCSHH